MNYTITLTAHPAADYCPMMDEQRFAELVQDIRANGLHDPITMLDGKILDGRNRYRACIEARVEPAFTEDCGDSPTQYVWSKNLARRDLTPSQRTAIAVEMLPPLKQEAKKRQVANLKQGQESPVPDRGQERGKDNHEAIEEAAAIVGVSGRQVYRAAIVKERDPKLFDEIKAGKINVRSAHRKVTEQDAQPPATPPASKMREGQKPRAERIAEIAKLASEGYRASQIADEIGVTVYHVRHIANEEGITLPDKAIGRVHRVKVRRVIEETVHGLAGYAVGLSTINGTFDDITAPDATEWAQSLAESMKPINKLRKRLMEYANGQS